MEWQTKECYLHYSVKHEPNAYNAYTRGVNNTVYQCQGSMIRHTCYA